ncbi:MAG: HDOD domain-containing protein [Deltaproteobacteria bacterium]|nr:HDOD domain-containing protein [Deltaproteobacteria bacterium]
MSYQEEVQVIELYHEFINTVVSLIEEKGQFLQGHCARVARYANIMATAIKLPPERIQEVYIAGLLHDVGYIVIREPILDKTNKLSRKDFDRIRTHPASGQHILDQLNLNQNILQYVRHHHEFFDGTGYPDGLADNKIPLGARIIALAEAFDAMTSERPYREIFTIEQAIEEILLQADRQFDPMLAKLFVDLMKRDQKTRKECQAPKIDTSKKQTLDNIVQDIIAAFKEGKISLPVLPEVLEHIQKVLLDPNTNMEDAASVIRGDVKISTSLIALANSPYYRRVQKVESVEQAVSRLGFKETSKLATLIANKSLYKCDKKRYKVLMIQCWKHGLACAYLAHFLARQLRLQDSEEYFTMGLIHDIGKGLLIHAISKVLQDKNLSIEFETSEVKEVVQKMHTSFGAALLKQWGFSDRYIFIAKQHETTSNKGNVPLELKVIQLANLLTRELDCRPCSHEGEDELIADIISTLQLSPQAVDLVIQRTQEVIEQVMTGL